MNSSPVWNVVIYTARIWSNETIPNRKSFTHCCSVITKRNVCNNDVGLHIFTRVMVRRDEGRKILLLLLLLTRGSLLIPFSTLLPTRTGTVWCPCCFVPVSCFHALIKFLNNTLYNSYTCININIKIYIYYTYSSGGYYCKGSGGATRTSKSNIITIIIITVR